MLQKLNERVQGIVAWLVVILIAVTFTLFGVDYYFQSHQTSDAKVVINDKPISNNAFETNYRRNRAQQDAAQMTADQDKNLQEQVLNQMIANEVTVQAARQYGFEVSSAQANAAILQIPQFQEDGHFSTERYQQALSGALFTAETFQNEVRQGMLLNQQRFAFIASSFALPGDIERFVRLYMQTRDYDYLTVSAAKLVRQIQVSTKEVQDYYQHHQAEFMSPEEVSVDYVTLSMQDIKAHINISEEDVTRFYDENKSNYLTPAQWQVAHLLFALPENPSNDELAQAQQRALDAYAKLQTKPALFAELVAQSDDKLSIPDKGVLPWITAGQNEYDQILSGLTKPGEISAPAKTKYGYEIFKLIAYKPVTTKTLAEVKSTIIDQLSMDMAQTQYAAALEQLSDLSYQYPDSLKSVAETLKLKVQHSELFPRTGGNSALTSNKQVVNTAFSHDVLNLSNNSEPVQLNNDGVVVLRVNQHAEAKQQPLADVEKKITNQLVEKKAEAKAKDIGALILKPSKDTKLKELFKQYQLQWNSVEKASRDVDTQQRVINEFAFNLLSPENSGGLSQENGDYVIVRLKKINDGDLSSLDEEQKKSLIQQIEASYGTLDYDLFVNSLVSHAKVEKG